MKIKRLFALILILFTSSSFCISSRAQQQNATMIYSHTAKTFVSFEAMIRNLADKEFIVLGENHDNAAHHDMQKKIMDAVAVYGPISVGLEFISWDNQEHLNHFILGDITEEDFLKKVKWGDGFPFDFYRPLIFAATQSGGHAFGINAPNWIVKKVARGGLDSLTNDELTYIPTNFEIGSDLYFKRFKKVMSNIGGGMPQFQIKRMFAAHSIWDDSMAFHSILNMQHSYAPFFIIVGNFHASYKLGLTARLDKRLHGSEKISTIVHVDASNLNSHDELLKVVEKHKDYGELADFTIFTF
ncbi:MAG: ChaN family lipoprotein [Bacteriovoracaceae bacterium]|nr:ChaN family lipoprotein [Bacteriovoracaceae bacterium]